MTDTSKILLIIGVTSTFSYQQAYAFADPLGQHTQSYELSVMM